VTHRVVCLRILHVLIDLPYVECDYLLLFLHLFLLHCDFLQDLQSYLVDLVISNLIVITDNPSHLLNHLLDCLYLTIGSSYEEFLE
jgi:hypothetical protein